MEPGIGQFTRISQILNFYQLLSVICKNIKRFSGICGIKYNPNFRDTKIFARKFPFMKIVIEYVVSLTVIPTYLVSEKLNVQILFYI